MECISAITCQAAPDKAVDDLLRQAEENTSGDDFDLALLFVSHHYSPAFSSILPAIREGVKTSCLVGCTGESIIGAGQEVEGRPAAALWIGRFPGVQVRPFALTTKSAPRFPRGRFGGIISM